MREPLKSVVELGEKRYYMPEDGNIVAVYSDAGLIPEPVVKCKNPSRYGGTWAYCWVNDKDERCGENWGAVVTKGKMVHWPTLVELTELESIENNLIELYAAVRALEYLPVGWSGKFCCDNELTLNRLFGTAAWNAVPAKLRQRGHEVVERFNQVEPVLIEGHPAKKYLVLGVGKSGRPVSKHNVWCDERCTLMAKSWLSFEMADKLA